MNSILSELSITASSLVLVFTLSSCNMYESEGRYQFEEQFSQGRILLEDPYQIHVENQESYVNCQESWFVNEEGSIDEHQEGCWYEVE